MQCYVKWCWKHAGQHCYNIDQLNKLKETWEWEPESSLSTFVTNRCKELVHKRGRIHEKFRGFFVLKDRHVLNPRSRWNKQNIKRRLTKWNLYFYLFSFQMSSRNQPIERSLVKRMSNLWRVKIAISIPHWLKCWMASSCSTILPYTSSFQRYERALDSNLDKVKR